MIDATRKPMIDRLTALVAGPFLMGRRALDLLWPQTGDRPPDRPLETPVRMAVTPPAHAIKRRG